MGDDSTVDSSLAYTTRLRDGAIVLMRVCNRDLWLRDYYWFGRTEADFLSKTQTKSKDTEGERELTRMHEARNRINVQKYPSVNYDK